MLCPKCGKEVKVGGKFCNSCGRTLNREAEKRAPSVSAPAPEKKARRKVVILGAIIVITILAAILAIVLFEPPLLLVAIGVGMVVVIAGVWLFCPSRIRLWVLAGIILLIAIAITILLIARPKMSRINLPEPVIIATVPIAGKDAVLTHTLAFAEKSNGQYVPKIVLSLDNFSPQTKSNVTVTEYIPKDFAQHVGDIEFSVPPTRILEDDPVVEWQIAELKPGEQKTITYYSHQTMPGPAVDNAVQLFHQLFQQATYFDDYSQITAIKSYLGVPSFELPEEAKTSEFLNRFYNIYYYPYDWMYFNYTFKQNPLAYFQDQKEGMLENANRYVAQASFAQGLKTYYDFIGLYGAINEAKPLGTIDKLYSIYKDLGFPESFIADDAQFIYQTVESAKDLAKTPDIIDDPDARKSTFDALFDQILMKQVEDQQRLDKLRAVRYGADVQVLKELIPLHQKAERGLVTENEAKALASLEIKHYIFQREVIKAEIEFLEWAINHVDLSDVIFGWWFPDASKNNLQRRLDAYRDLEIYFSVSAEVRAKAITDVINNPAVPSSQPPLSASPEAQPSATPQQSSGSSPGNKVYAEETVLAVIPDGQLVDNDDIKFSKDGTKVAYTTKGGKRGEETAVVLNGAVGSWYANVKDFSFSPNSRRFAYEAWGTTVKASSEFVVVDGQEGKAYGDVADVKFSPDGQKVAYEASYDWGRYTKWFSVINGEEGTVYGSGLGGVYFSPDSQKLAFWADKENKDAVVVNGQEVSQVYSAKWYANTKIFFSPNSQRMAYWARSEGKDVIVVDGREMGREYDVVGFEFIFSPDSQRTAYRAKKGDKWLVVTDGQEGKAYDGVSNLTFSPDSTKIAYLAYNSQDEKYFVVVNGEEGPVYNRIETGTYLEGDYLLFSPDSQKIAYYAQGRIVINGEEHEPYSEKGNEGDCCAVYTLYFSPDSKKVASLVTSGYAATTQWFMVVDGRKGKMYDRIFSSTISFSPDGKKIMYGARLNNKLLWVVEPLGK